jgi:hypothetical protein
VPVPVLVPVPDPVPPRFRPMTRLLRTIIPVGLALLWPSLAVATPGQAVRLGGIELQGPASRAVTALHHNPAMLAAMAGTAAHVSFTGGIDQLRVRRHDIDPASGAPIGTLSDPTSVVNPAGGYFMGVNFYIDPIAVGVGLYDLSSQSRFVSADALRYHLAPDPDAGCLNPGKSNCPPLGGQVTSRNDLTVALAWNGGRVQLGAAVHFPRLRTRFAFDNDTALMPDAEGMAARCDVKEDPQCAERVGFKGWTHWIATGGTTPGFDAALTFGAAVSFKGEAITLGARYRTFPLRRGGEVALAGVAMVCRPDGEQVPDGPRTVPHCSVASPGDATLRERLPQEFAIGGSFVLGRARLWRVDTNLYWMDLCPGGLTAAGCADAGSQSLRLVGLDRNAVVLPDFQRYRGLQDLYGIDVYGSYRVRSNAAITFGGHFASPAVRRDATTAAHNEGWRLGGSVGARFRLRQTNFLLVPGYGIDAFLPRHVAPGRALFDPGSATSFEAARGDINAPGAKAVLEGRAHPTNAGRYFGLLHVFSLALTWGERSTALD